MPRYKLTVEYDGRPFAGWQRQADQPSVQGALEDAIRALDPDAPGIGGAGRTDAGVHATGQVAHCDMIRDWDPFRLAEALNWHLKPAPVSVLAAERAADDFHARFDAIERRYLFVVVARRSPLTVDKGRAWRVPGPLALDPMREAAAHLLGRHDFTTFRSSICQAKSPVKTLDALDIEARPTPGGTRFEFRLRARSFLHNQVRSLVGTLERVGAGRWAPARVAEALAARDRAACGPVAPPDGLYLTDVIYPESGPGPGRGSAP
ncbi:MAG: tRNA pseudouridine(38-40) synthase TruA [Pseudomonadota bacterium]|nr:tRNA pseudouridine(38-40) synthase TruA [Pseudomonadota bacterium]MEE3099591.1 tRNA pseudouridine(38-40) synthase TruA [Pseudomonadota bacterium]